MQCGLFYEAKIQVTFLLQRLLFEFQQQETIEIGNVNGDIQELQDEEDSIQQEQLGEKTMLLLERVIKDVVDGKIDGFIKALLLQEKKFVLSKQTLAMINSESKIKIE